MTAKELLRVKELLRREIKNHLKIIGREEFRIQGAEAAATLRRTQLWSRYTTVFLFLSMNDEIDTQSLLEMAFNDGKKIFLPRVKGSNSDNSLPDNSLVFYTANSPDGPWDKGPFDIREPRKESTPVATGDFPALIITPGLAFDREGNRLGRGRGYYDRFFADLDAAGREYTSIGLCMDFQITGQVPAGDNDKKMDSLLAGKEFAILK